MAVANVVSRLSEADYLALERAAPFKSEFFGGEMFTMAGGSPMHSLIAANLIGGLRAKLKGRLWRSFTSDLRLKIEATGLFTFAGVDFAPIPIRAQIRPPG